MGSNPTLSARQASRMMSLELRRLRRTYGVQDALQGGCTFGGYGLVERGACLPCDLVVKVSE